MTATGELRRLLDERGVEWMPSAWSARDETFYKVGNTGFLATEMSGGRMKVCVEGYVTPEQAVEAALGSDLKAENAKLRELVRDMWLDLQKQLTPPWSGEYRQRMYELEVEP